MLEPPHQPEGPAEIVQDEVRVLDSELRHGALQEARVGRDFVWQPARLVGLAEAGHVERHGSAEGADGGHQRGPVGARAGVSVHEQDRLALAFGPGFDNGRADRVDLDAACPHAVSQRAGFWTNTVSKTSSSITPCSRSAGTTSSKTSVIDQLRIAPWLSKTASASDGNQSIVAQ